MNDQQLNDVLGAIYAGRTREPVPEEVQQRAWAVPVQVAPRRGWFERVAHGGLSGMFSATRAVVAGVIVAVFGGFLLSGALSPSDDTTAPAAGVSGPPTASASTTPRPTTAATPTAEATESPVPRSRASLLPGVALEFEAIKPGVTRVLSDGVRDLARNVRDVAVSPDGDVWIVKYEVVRVPDRGAPGEYAPFYKDNRLMRLGEAGNARKSRGTERNDKLDSRAWSLREHADVGVILEAGDGQFTFDGNEWIEHDPDGSGLPCELPATSSDGGTVRSVLSSNPGVSGSRAIDGQCWSLNGFTRDLDVSGDACEACVIEAQDILPEGTNGRLNHFDVDHRGWVRTTLRAIVGTALVDVLAAYDGEAWRTVPITLDGGGPEFSIRPSFMAVAPDGDVWLSHASRTEDEDSQLIVNRWDGAQWTAYGPVPLSKRHERETHFLPDGTIMFGRAAALFDGSKLRPLDPLGGSELEGYEIGPLEFTPDGAAWTVAAEPNREDAEGNVDAGVVVLRPQEFEPSTRER